MQSLAHYALLGSLVAAAAGALVVTAVTVKHGFKRREVPDADQSPEDIARRHRLIRLADTVAVLCFAVSAGLGVVGLMQHTRTVTPAVAATDDATLSERLHALEKRLATTEIEVQARGAPAPDWRAWEERIARLESRLGAVEERAAVAERRAVASEQIARARPRTTPAATPPRAVAPVKPLPAPAPEANASPRLAPAAVDVVVAPEPPLPPKAEPSATVAATATPPPPPAPRETARPPAPARPEEPSLADKFRRDWESVKRQARRGGEEWRDGWDQFKRLFGY